MKSIGYMGSKEKLLTFIEAAMRDYFGEKYNEIKTFFDCFSGSGRVANHFKNQFSVTTNDKQFFTKVINNAFLNNKHSSEHFKPLIDHLNNLDEEYFYKTDGWFTKTYSMNHNVNGTLHEDGTRKLFLSKNGRKIDMIRHRIDEMFDAGEIDQEAKDVLIVCLMRAISLVQNAGGHQNSYYSEWKDKAFKDLVLTYPTIEPSVNTHTHFNADIEDVIESVESDVIYIDPPYGSTVPYSAYYHLYNTVAENSRPQVSMMASKPVHCYGKSKLEKNKKNEVMKSFIDLISASKSKTVVLSYHDEGLLSHSDLVKVMELSGCDVSSLKTYGTNHKANLQSLSAVKDKGQKLRSVVEYVIIVNKARFSVVRSSAEVKEEIAKHLSLCIESDFEEIAYVYDKQSNSFEAPQITLEPTPAANDEPIQLFNEDALQRMSKMADESVDLVVTDPPYKICSGGKGKSNQPKGMLNNDNRDVRSGSLFKHNEIKFSQWLPEVYRVLKEGSHAYFMTNAKNLNDLMNEALKAGFHFHNLLTWKKNNATPNRWYMQNSEFILFFRKGKAKSINDCGTKTVIEVDNIIGNKVHPTEKPVELMEILIGNSSNENDVIFDPFAGSGATLEAAKNLNRNAIGIELDEEYFDVASKRLNINQKGLGDKSVTNINAIKQTKNEEKTMAHSIRKVKNKLQSNEKFRDELLSMIDESIPIINKFFPYSNLQSQSDYIKEMLNGKTQFSGHFVSMYIHELKDTQKDLMCIDEIYVAFQSEPYNKRAIKNLQLINAGLCVLDYALTHNVSLSEAYLEMKFKYAA
ncbi:hypothetical protein FG067_17710 [Vibrio cholerae]|nr:hypothetical protein [Vibrio cholerae]ELJ8600121.1 DNA adenine methylase [Vibrio cholerae]